MKASIVVIAPSYHPKLGGVEKHIRNVVKVLQNEYRITIYVRYNSEIPKRQVVDGLTVIRMPQDSRIGLTLFVVRHITTLLRASAIHTHDYFPPIMRKLFRNKKWIHTFHGYEGYPIDPAAIKSRQAVSRIVDYRVGIGAFIEKWYKTPCDYISYGAIDEISLKRQPAKWDAVFYGRLEPDTGFKNYLEAFAIIAKKHPQAKLLVLGDGSLKKWARQYVESNGLKVELKPAVQDVIPYVNQSSIALVSGYLAILEAQILKKPIISYYDTPIKNDYLTCHPMAKNFAICDTTSKIAEAYEQSLNPDPNRLAASHAWAKKQTWEKIAGVYSAQYNNQEVAGS